MIVLIGSDIGMSVFVGQVKLMSECSGSIDSVKRVKLILNDEELEDQGLTTLTTADKQTGRCH